MYNYSYREITKVTIKSHARRHVDVENGTPGRCDRPIRYIIPYRATSLLLFHGIDFNEDAGAISDFVLDPGVR
jgi:hypothetical protein